MSDCTKIQAETPDVSLLRLNEEVNLAKQIVDNRMAHHDQNTIMEPDRVCTDSAFIRGNRNDSSNQATRKISEVNASLSNNIATPKEHGSSAQSEVLQKSGHSRGHDESFEYIDSVNDNCCLNDSLEKQKLKGHDINTELCGDTPTNTTVSVDFNNEGTVLGTGKLFTGSVLSNVSNCGWEEEKSVASDTLDSTLSREKECHTAKQSQISTVSSELDNGNNSTKPSEWTGKLIEGPRITLPPSQLLVMPSYPTSPSSPLSNSTSGIASINTEVPQPSSNMPHNNNNNIADIHNYQQKEGHPTYAEIVQREQKSPASSAVVEHGAGGVAAQGLTASRQKVDSASQVDKPALDSGLSDPAKPKAKRTPNDFIFGKVIGEGSYSTVYLAKEVATQREFAIKVCDKKHLIRERKTHFVMREKEVLMKLDHPFFIKLAYTFQDPERLYYVLTYARNGELLGYLHKLSAFDVPCSRFYSAEIILALEYLHGLGIIHRDLKPENILLGEDMHIKITDFGTSKILPLDSNASADNTAETKRKNSFVGTAEYVSPEILNNQPANYGSDLWALGCIIYQCLSGSLPFRSGNEYQTFQKIIKVEYEFPQGFYPEAKDLIQKLLVFEPSVRLGMVPPEGMKALKNHSFYTGIDWENLPQATPPKLMPYLPATASNPEFWGQEQRTGFDDQRLAEIITGQSADGSVSPEFEEVPICVLSQAEDAERAEKLKKQKLENQFHQFVNDNLIVRQGFVDKRKGLFARKRMLLLTEGPHLYYVDAHNKVLKGEIPWSKYLRPEAKNFKIFFVHTPNRTYYLESRQPDAQQWVKEIKDIWMKYFGKEMDNGGKR